MSWQLFILSGPDKVMISKIARVARELDIPSGNFVVANLYAPDRKSAGKLKAWFDKLSPEEKTRLVKSRQFG